MAYVDGFLLPVPSKHLAAYRLMARKAAKIWMEYGALEYRECVAEDMKSSFGVPFPKAAGAKKGETVVFSWIVYKNKKQRDAVNKKIMADARIAKMMDPTKPIFDCTRMCYGGFEVIVDKAK